MVAYASIRAEQHLAVGVTSVRQKISATRRLEASILGVLDHSPVVRRALPARQNVSKVHIQVNNREYVLTKVSMPVPEAALLIRGHMKLEVRAV